MHLPLHTQLGGLKLKRQSADEDVEPLKLSYATDGITTRYTLFQKQLDIFL